MYMFHRIIFILLIVSGLFRNFNRCAGCFQSNINRDLKQQDREIRVKSGARPASRATRLNMLSNIATATSRLNMKIRKWRLLQKVYD